MSKIASDQLHRNDRSSSGFNVCLLGVLYEVRRMMAQLSESRKADMSAPGAIHALRKLCDGEGKSGHIPRQEVEEWQEIFFAWFKRVKRWFPKELADKFKANAEDDFRVILASASNTHESMWRKKSLERHIELSWKDEEALAAARKAADDKHPVRLGSPLHEYLKKCAAQLVDDEAGEIAPESPATTDAKQQAASLALLAPRYLTNDDGTVSLLLDRFDSFDTPEDLEQDIVTTAYEVEDAVKNYVQAKHKKLADDLHFDCESSLFCVVSKSPAALAAVSEAMLALALNRELYLKYRKNN